MRALVSIHDVMPNTLKKVCALIRWLEERQVQAVTLLVVPGLNWAPDQIDCLRELNKAGYKLAAHGWAHVAAPKRLYHRLHAALISRNVAEHLALNSGEILDLLQRSRDWFAANNLALPDFYVPPAWALGPLSDAELKYAPFNQIETTRGLITLHREQGLAVSSGEQSPATIHFEKLPLTGYEADTPIREHFLRRWNAWQSRGALRTGKPLRISIHPDDLQLRIPDQLTAQIESVEEFLPYPWIHRRQ